MDRSVCPAVVTLLPYPYSYSTTDTLVPATQSSSPLATTHASRLTTPQVWNAVDTSQIPENLKDISATPTLLVEPKMEAHVFCKAVRQHA